jgi:hypothetical protein
MPEYFEDLKNYLDITFDDDDIDAKLSGICTRAEAYLNKAAGGAVDLTDQSALQLLFDCIRYIWSGSLDEFAQNYADDLFMLRANVHADTVNEEDDG